MGQLRWLSASIGRDVGLYFYSNLSPTVVVISVSLFLIAKNLQKVLPPNKLVDRISSSMLGVYLVHPLFIGLLNRAGLSAIDFNPIFGIPLVGVLTLLLSLLATILMQKIPFLRRVV